MISKYKKFKDLFAFNGDIGRRYRNELVRIAGGR
jgi:hypothetical protein